MLMNYVNLETGTPTRMHFTDDYEVARLIEDRDRPGKTKRISSLVLQVDELNGENVSRTFSILSEKLRGKLQGYLPERRYRNWDFVITKRGEGYGTTFEVEALPRPEVG